MISIWGGRKETNQLKENFPEEIDGDYWSKKAHQNQLSSGLIVPASFRGEPCCAPLPSISNDAYVLQSQQAILALFSERDINPSKPECKQLILGAGS